MARRAAALLLPFALLAGLVASSGCSRARVHPLVEVPPARLTQGAPEVFATLPERPYREIAVITTEPREGMEDEVLRRHLRELTRGAERAGADAVINVRLITVKKHGYVRDTNVPFPSAKQGTWGEFILRGTAVVYDDAPAPDASGPEEGPGAAAADGDAADSSPDAIEAAPAGEPEAEVEVEPAPAPAATTTL